jgi:hypothetical protein
MNAQWKRIEAIIGNDETATFEDQLDAFHEHLLRSLELPCEVTGYEDFRWEEPYVLGVGSRAERARRIRTSTICWRSKRALFRNGCYFRATTLART